jgi:hypothetical protein
MSDLPALPQTDILAQASQESLQELWARDPVDLSDQELDKLIQKLRENRLRFQQMESQPKPSKAAKPTAKALLANPPGLEDLGF